MKSFFLHYACMGLMLAILADSVHAAPRVATSDWTTAETLTAMGHPPVGMGDKRAYKVWVNYPVMPDSVADSGLRFQPNLERLREIKPDLFIQTSWFAHLKPQFEQIAPVREVDFADKNGVRYIQLQNSTRVLGQIIGDVRAAERLIHDTDQQLNRQRQMLKAYTQRPLAVVQFVDARHLRVYGNNSLFHITMQKLGLKNAWQGASNEWGFSNIGLIDLAKLPSNSILLIVQPHPYSVRTQLEKSILWQRLPFSHKDNHRIIPPSWSYGGLPSVQQFANQLSTHLPRHLEQSW